MPTSFAGHAANSSECVIGPMGRETGLTGSAGRTPISSPTGSYAMATAEHREPCESRGSCTVLDAVMGPVPQVKRNVAVSRVVGNAGSQCLAPGPKQHRREYSREALCRN